MWAEWDKLVKEIMDSYNPSDSEISWWFMKLVVIGQRLRDAHAHAVHTRDKDFRMVATSVEDLFYALEKSDDELLKESITSLEDSMGAVGFPIKYGEEDVLF